MTGKVKAWAMECAERLQEQWPRVGMDDLENLAEALAREPRWAKLAPREAAIEWLAQGIPTLRHEGPAQSR